VFEELLLVTAACCCTVTEIQFCHHPDKEESLRACAGEQLLAQTRHSHPVSPPAVAALRARCGTDVSVDNPFTDPK